MAVDVRPATVRDRAAPGLLHASAAPYYAAYAGSDERARRMLEAVWPRPGHTASVEVCHVAQVDGAVVGVLAAFPAADADRLARRFLRLSMRRLPLRRWPAVVRHLRASARVTPLPPADVLYVDALAVATDARRQGVATRLLDEASRLAAVRGLRAVALDTGVENAAGRALYAAVGFEPRGEHRAPDARTAKIVGGAGFVSLQRPVRA